MSRTIVGGILLAALAAPGFTAGRQWSVTDASARNCMIVEQNPTTATTTVVERSKTAANGTAANRTAQTRTEVRTWRQFCSD